MLSYLDTLLSSGKNGTDKDVLFIDDDYWLQDTAVIENVEKRRGEWNIYLVFAHSRTPLKFIKRKIVNFACPKRAALAAHYMRRLAAKDQRGTLIVKNELFEINFN